MYDSLKSSNGILQGFFLKKKNNCVYLCIFSWFSSFLHNQINDEFGKGKKRKTQPQKTWGYLISEF